VAAEARLLALLALIGCSNSPHEQPATECVADSDCRSTCGDAADLVRMSDAGARTVSVAGALCRRNYCFCVLDVDGTCQVGFSAGRYSCSLSLEQIYEMCTATYTNCAS
jgi:hypothetical protein